MPPQKNPNASDISRSNCRKIKLFAPIFPIHDFLIFDRIFVFMRDCLHIYFCSNSEILNTNPYFLRCHSICYAALAPNIKFCCSKSKSTVVMSKNVFGVRIHIEKRKLEVLCNARWSKRSDLCDENNVKGQKCIRSLKMQFFTYLLLL